jgi:hypothetical protein
LGNDSVNGRRRVPSPPTKTTAFTGRQPFVVVVVGAVVVVVAEGAVVVGLATGRVVVVVVPFTTLAE